MADVERNRHRRMPGWLRAILTVGGIVIAAEVGAEAVMRVRAAQQFPDGYCGFGRAPIFLMIEQTMQEPGTGRFGYARVTAGEQGYLWSFKTFSFEPESLSCRDPRAGWCWCLASIERAR